MQLLMIIYTVFIATLVLSSDTNNDYFGNLFDIYTKDNERSREFAKFNEKYFLQVNPEMKQVQFEYYGHRDPLIVVYGDMAVYFYHRANEFEQFGFDPKRIYNRTYTIETYDILKTISHSTLYIYYMFSIEIMKQFTIMRSDHSATLPVELTQETIDKLNEYMNDLDKLDQELNSVNLCNKFENNEQTDMIQIQHDIVKANKEFILSSIKKKTITFEENESFAKSTLPLLMKSTETVARITLANLDHIVNEWREFSKLTEQEFQRTRVIVIAGSSPRLNCMQSQFFRHLLKQHRMGDRVIYAENMWTAKEALRRLKDVIVDQAVGEAFFNDRYRMQEDLFADVAYQYLKSDTTNMQSDYLKMIQACPHLRNQNFLKRK
jgi:hypothetical protein